MNRREFNLGVAGLAAVWVVDPLAIAHGTDTLRVNGARLNQHLAELAEFGKNPQGGVSRVAYSEADRQGREYVMGLMRAAKLNVSIDAAGNIIGRRRESSETNCAPSSLARISTAFRKAETTTAMSVHSAPSKSRKRSPKTMSSRGIRSKWSSFKTKKAD